MDENPEAYPTALSNVAPASILELDQVVIFSSFGWAGMRPSIAAPAIPCLLMFFFALALPTIKFSRRISEARQYAVISHDS
jgi:hypothetical protein